MLVGIDYADLGHRSRVLLLATAALAAVGLVLFATGILPARFTLLTWLVVIVLLGTYWLSFLVEFRGRLSTAQVIVASLLGLAPWLFVAAVVLLYPRWLLALVSGAA